MENLTNEEMFTLLGFDSLLSLIVVFLVTNNKLNYINWFIRFIIRICITVLLFSITFAISDNSNYLVVCIIKWIVYGITAVFTFSNKVKEDLDDDCDITVDDYPDE